MAVPSGGAASARRGSTRRRTRIGRSAGRTPRPSTRPAPAPAVDYDGRDRILSAAIRSFAERGYEGATTAAVARAAGVTQPLVHHHFGSKEGLWRAAMDVLFSDVPRLVAMPADVSPPARLLAIVEQFVRFSADRPEVTRVIAREGAAPSPRLEYLVARHLAEPFRQIVEAMRAGQRAGFLAPELRPELLLFLILGAGSHLFDVTALARESLDLDPTVPRTREDFVAVVRTLLARGLVREPARPRQARATRARRAR